MSRAGALACVRASARRPARSGRVLQEACPWTEGPPTRNGRGGVAGEELAGRRRGGRGRGVCAAVAGHRGGQRGRREPSPTSGQDSAGVKPRNRQAPAAGSQGAPCPARAGAGRAGGSAAPAPAPPGDAGTPRGGRTCPPTLPLPDGRPPPSRTRSGGRKGESPRLSVVAVRVLGRFQLPSVCKGTSRAARLGKAEAGPPGRACGVRPVAPSPRASRGVPSSAGPPASASPASAAGLGPRGSPADRVGPRLQMPTAASGSAFKETGGGYSVCY